MMLQFVELAGGAHSAKLIVIPNASGDPSASGRDMVEEFKALGASQARCVYMTRAEASRPESAQTLSGATGVYFTGGDQVPLARDLVGTPMHDKLKALYFGGAVMGGTSAGAAVMSEIMITGEEHANSDTNNPFGRIQQDNVVTSAGFGFITRAIIDQHFVRRKRHNRLISLMLEHPTLLGIGIDESTAIVVSPKDLLEVVGAGPVIVYDPTRTRGLHSDENGNLAATDLVMHILLKGDRYDLARRKVLPAKP
jgi:cyanophycinase